jgi:hypothetical protein
MMQNHRGLCARTKQFTQGDLELAQRDRRRRKSGPLPCRIGEKHYL